MCTLRRQSQVAEQLGIFKQTWKISPVRPSAGASEFDCFSLQWQQHGAVNQRLLFPASAHFPGGLYPGRPRSADNPSFHDAPEEQEITAQERAFPEGPLDYN